MREDFAAGLICEVGGKLVVVRDPDKTPSLWKFPAGRNKNQETPVECALREAREETGVRGDPNFTVLLAEEGRRRPEDKRHRFFLFQCVRCDTSHLKELGSEGGIDKLQVRLMTAREILEAEDFMESHKRLAREYLENLAKWTR